jgi:hypothetical protein
MVKKSAKIRGKNCSSRTGGGSIEEVEENEEEDEDANDLASSSSCSRGRLSSRLAERDACPAPESSSVRREGIEAQEAPMPNTQEGAFYLVAGDEGEVRYQMTKVKQGSKQGMTITRLHLSSDSTSVASPATPQTFLAPARCSHASLPRGHSYANFCLACLAKGHRYPPRPWPSMSQEGWPPPPQRRLPRQQAQQRQRAQPLFVDATDELRRQCSGESVAGAARAW